MINSHQPLTGPVAWYEAHVKSEEGWDMHGGVFPGMPFIAKGFNPDIGWGVTVNKPDLVDIYRLTPKGEGYLLDGAEVAFERRRIWLKLKIIGNFYLAHTAHHSGQPTWPGTGNRPWKICAALCGYGRIAPARAMDGDE